MDTASVEIHPLAPFLPPQARILMLGSFPPPRKRWSMEFFYPNYTNDMWRIFGLIFFDDKDHFVDTAHKCFRREAIESFLREQGIAISDTVAVARRLNGNASDLTLGPGRAARPGPSARPDTPLPHHRHHRTEGHRYPLCHHRSHSAPDR